MKENSEIWAILLQGHFCKFYASWSSMPWLTHWSFFFFLFSPSSRDSCCTITRVPLWFVPKPEVKIKLSKSSEFDLPVQLWAEKLLCQAWPAIKHLWPRAKKYDPLKVNCEILSFLPTNCSAALPPQGHLTSRLSSPREMRFHFPVQELRRWKVRITHSCLREALKLCTNQQPRDYRNLWWIANPTE